MADHTPTGEPPDAAGYAIGTPDRVMAGILLAGSLLLAYICLDVLAGGALTRTLTRRRPA